MNNVYGSSSWVGVEGVNPSLLVVLTHPDSLFSHRSRAACYARHAIETLTAVAAVVGAVGSLAVGAGVLVVNGKLDRLTGRGGAVESTLQTLMVGLIGRSGAK